MTHEVRYFALKFTSTLPSLPFFVVIRITPAAAREPYRADAAGPLRIDIFSISSGLISITRLEPVVAEAFIPSYAELPIIEVELS